MISTMKLILALATVLGVVITTVNSMPPKKQKVNRDNTAVEDQLRNAAQQALDAIGSTRTLTASHKLADRGQHVFNNNLLKFHRKVLQDLLNEVGASEQLNNLMEGLMPLSEDQQEAIGNKMVAHFSQDEFYVDYNAAVYGAYVEKLREALVAYLKADTSEKDDERNRITTQVELITNNMVNRNVFVDPMARDHWVQKDQNRLQQYNEVRDALRDMIQNILEHFKIVSEKIKHYYKTNNRNR